MNILIVNQSAHERNFLIRLLSTFELDNPDYKQTSDGYEAIGLIQSSHIDLIITDLKMPNISGEQLIIEIRRLQSRTPIIIISGHIPSDPISASAMKRGTQGFLQKPFASKNEVVALVHKFTVKDDRSNNSTPTISEALN